jgi:hypothetical protein
VDLPAAAAEYNKRQLPQAAALCNLLPVRGRQAWEGVHMQQSAVTHASSRPLASQLSSAADRIIKVGIGSSPGLGPTTLSTLHAAPTSQIGFPLQYFNDWRRKVWSFVFLSQLLVSKVLPWLMPPPAFMMVQDFRLGTRRGKPGPRVARASAPCNQPSLWPWLGQIPARTRLIALRPGELHPSLETLTYPFYCPVPPQLGLCHHPQAHAARAAGGPRAGGRLGAEHRVVGGTRRAARIGRTGVIGWVPGPVLASR